MAEKRQRRQGLGRLAHIALTAGDLACALTGVLTLRRAPSMRFLLAKVATTEWGYVLAAFYLMCVLLVRRKKGARWILLKAAFSGGAVLMTIPVLRAAHFARGLPLQISQALGQPADDSALPKPFSFRRLIHLRPLRRSAQKVVFDPDHELDFELYSPCSTSAGHFAPCVLVVHGGRWTDGSSRDTTWLSSYLCDRGYAVVTVNYRKVQSNQNLFPAALDDVRSALEHVKRHGGGLGIDPHRIVLLGRSAGAQLALLAAYEAKDPAVKGVISLYGPTDMLYGYFDRTNPRVIDSKKVLETYLGCDPHSAKERYEQASPVRFVMEQSPPTLLIHGLQDEMVHIAHSDMLAQKLGEAGVVHAYLRLPWAEHGFDHNLNGPSGQLSTYAVERFLSWVFAR